VAWVRFGKYPRCRVTVGPEPPEGAAVPAAELAADPDPTAAVEELEDEELEEQAASPTASMQTAAMTVGRRVGPPGRVTHPGRDDL